MTCVICLDEEVPSTITPCKTCFNVRFHETCLQAYRRTNNVCPTCKNPYEYKTVFQTTQEDEEEEVCCIQVDMYFVCTITQMFILIFTLAFVSRTDLFQFWTLMLTLLFVACRCTFECARMTTTICAGITTACTLLNTVVYNHDPICIAYAGLTFMNMGVYAIDRTLKELRELKERRQISPDFS